MSISLSLFFKQSLNIDVSELIIEASKIFRILSGQRILTLILMFMIQKATL